MTSKSDSSSAHTQPLWYVRSPVPTPLGIAVHLGWLNGELSADGVAIRSLRDSTRHDRSSISDHTLAQSFRQGGSIPAMWARSNGANTRLIGLSWVDESQLILALPASGIHSVAALRGRRLAIPRRRADRIDIFRASALRGFVNALSLEGLSTRDVDLVDVEARTLQSVDAQREPGQFASPDGFSSRSLYAAEAAALLRGQVDAIYVKGSTGLEIAQVIGAQVVIDIGFHPERRIRNNNGTPRPLTVNADVLAQHPDIVEGFLKLVVDAGEWAKSHPDETVDYVTQETASSLEWVRTAYGPVLHQHLGVNLEAESIAALAEFKDFLYEWGFLEADFDVADWIDPRPLGAVLAPALRKHA
ncbi:ABC transporter substrate-binding protein [Paraburkholderia pallida]|uniref:ABC transporter substrate-binding protein n=1 Tax=Paraburkholderia pallida TaxID=2547399 RepID=A0A4P7CVV4_9BURK|nr:ABC transporter substrate-binding protein [Paraburkholderia pallida]QBQ98876.1 ABC transporter substrate-binding protein [Paraburkholderia pallida]